MKNRQSLQDAISSLFPEEIEVWAIYDAPMVNAPTEARTAKNRSIRMDREFWAIYKRLQAKYSQD